MKINLCVGPMSMNTINSINQFSKRYKKYITIVCSRNQIESEKLGGGYVNNFTTENFSKYIKKLDNKYLLIERSEAQNIKTKNQKTFKLKLLIQKKVWNVTSSLVLNKYILTQFLQKKGNLI